MKKERRGGLGHGQGRHDVRRVQLSASAGGKLLQKVDLASAIRGADSVSWFYTRAGEI